MKKKPLIFIALCILLINLSSFSYALSTYGNRTIEGFLTGIDGEELEIEEYGGSIYRMAVAEDAIIKIDNRDAQLSDFRPGIEVYGKVSEWKLTYIEGYSTSNLGYIKEGGKYRSGIVKRIDRNQLVVELPWNEEETYYTFPGTIVIKDNRAATLDTLYEGDRVKLYFDEFDSNIIGRVEIEEDTSIKIKELYRGDISFSDFYENSITFEDLEVFKNGRWRFVGNSITIPYSSDAPIYTGGTKIPPTKLKYYNGKRVYIAVKDFFGQDKIERMVIQNLYERSYSDKIKSINWYTEDFELSNKINLKFNDGTIIIKNGRMVDKYSLNPYSDALVITDGRNNERITDVIYVYNEDVNNSNIGQSYIYAGELEEITKNKVILDDFFLLEKNEWESFRDEKELFYDDDTFIYDLEEDEMVRAEEFFMKDYSVDDRNRNGRDWHGYVYTDGDRISAILVKKRLDSLNSQRVTNGTVERLVETSSVGWRAYLRDAKDWSPSKEQWMARRSTLRLLLNEAMIIKDNRMISPEELKPQDRLYLLRNSSKARIIIVK